MQSHLWFRQLAHGKDLEMSFTLDWIGSGKSIVAAVIISCSCDLLLLFSANTVLKEFMAMLSGLCLLTQRGCLLIP